MNNSILEPIVPTEAELLAAQKEAEAQKNTKEARRAVSRLGLALAAFLLLPQIVAALLYALVPFVFPLWAETDWFFWLVQVFAMYVVGLSAFLLILGSRPLPKLTAKPERFSFPRLLVFFCILEFCALAGSLISTVLTTVFGFLRGAPIVDATSELITSSPLIYTFLVVVVIGPIVEEVVYRHCVMRTLLPYGERVAVLVSGLLFGLMHGNFFQLFYATGIGILFSYLYTRSGKLRYTIGAHMLFNFFGGFLPAALMQALPLDALMNGELEGAQIFAYLLPLGGLVLYELLFFALAIAGLVLFIIFFRRSHFYPAACPLAKEGRARVYFLNAGMLVFLALAALLLFLSLL